MSELVWKNIELVYDPETQLYSVQEDKNVLGLKTGWYTRDRAEAVQCFWCWAQVRRAR